MGAVAFRKKKWRQFFFRRGGRRFFSETVMVSEKKSDSPAFDALVTKVRNVRRPSIQERRRAIYIRKRRRSFLHLVEGFSCR